MPKAKNSGAPMPVDPETYAPDIEAALHAFGSDVSYAVHIARTAVNLGRKRKMFGPGFARA